MRLMLVASFVACSLISGSPAAQSLEETYAKLCSKPAEAKTEACQILSKSLVEKLQAQQAVPTVTPAATVPEKPRVPERVGMQRWGFFADLIDQELIDIQFESKGGVVFNAGNVKYVWDVPGEVMGVQVKQPDGTFKGGVALHWDVASQGLREVTEGQPGALLRWQSDGSTVATIGMSRMTFRKLPVDSIEITLEGDKGQGWELMNRRHRVKATPSNYEAQALMKQINANAAETNKLMADIQRMDAEHKSSPLWQQTLAARANAESERERKREARANGGQMFGAIMQGLAQGMAEVNTGGYAEAQANLDASVANIQAAAAIERQQQALAAQQAQARAAEEQRQKHAENARWVAEKEQAAAEYRSGQVDAATAREAQLVAQQQADQQRRAALAAERQSAERVTTAKRQQAQSAALAERAPITAQPVAVAEQTNHATTAAQTPQASLGQQIHSGPTELYVFFIISGGQTVAFEGPLRLALAESKAMEARLQGEAPGKYGAGAKVDRRWRGPGQCLYVYQLPGEGRYLLGSGSGSVEAEKNKNGHISNGKATIHHDVKC